MAVVTVSYDGTRYANADALSETGGAWTNDDGKSTVVLETDAIYQGTNSISEKIGTTRLGIVFTGTSAVNFATGPSTLILKMNVSNYKNLLAYGPTTQGMNARVGTGGTPSTAYWEWYLFGNDNYPALGGWQIIPLDINLVAFRDTTTGSPSTTSDMIGGMWDFSAAAKTENCMIDAIDYITNGQGWELYGGDGASTRGVFQDFVDADEGAGDANGDRAGIITTKEGVIYVVGTLRFGVTAAVGFDDSFKSLVFPAGRYDEGFSGLYVDLTDTADDVQWNVCSFTSNGKAAQKQFFDTNLEVDGTNEEIDITGHGYDTGDYVLYSKEGGTDAIGLTDATYYFVEKITDDAFALHTSRNNALSAATPVGLTAATSPGENHSFKRAPDNRAHLTVSGTTATAGFASTNCTFNGFTNIDLTSKCTVTGGFILNIGNILLSTATLSNADISSPTTEEGEALVTPLTPAAMEGITGCTFTSNGYSHAFELTSSDATGRASNNTYTGYWAPAANGWNFHTQTGIDDTTELITTDAAHGFADGEAVFYNNEGGTDSIGLTNAAKYYIEYVSTTTFYLHATKAAAIAGASGTRINLTDGTGGETHSLYSSNATIFNDSAGACTINVASGSSTPSIRNGTGASTTVNNNITVTFTGMKDNTEVRVYKTSDDSVVGGIENATAGTPDNRSFAWSASAGTNVYYMLINKNYEVIRVEGYIVPASDSTIPVFQRFDRNYENP